MAAQVLQLGDLGQGLLHVVLTEVALAGFKGGADVRSGLGLADRQKGDP